MKEAQVTIKLKEIALRGEINKLPKMAIYSKALYYADKHKLKLNEYIEMVTGMTYAPPKERRSRVAIKYPAHVLWRRLQTTSVAKLAKEASCTRVAIYNLIDRYRAQGIWHDELDQKEAKDVQIILNEE